MRNQINLAALLAAFVLTATTLQAQLVINNTVDAVDGVQNVLLGDGVTVSNITFSGVNQQVAEFTCTDCNLGIASGLIMGSGNVDIAPGPNNSGSATGAPSSGYGVGDPDLTTLTGSTSLNGACVIEFDFVPTGDSVAFDYVFASEEYSEYLGYGDTFGFFLSGPGISGPYSNSAQNIALIPGTSLAVSVPNVNNGPNNTGPCNNCSYFVWNGTGFTSPYNSDDYYIQYDGFTTVLTATAEVQCGETYHIKLAIADMFDDSWDCAVFLAAGSFQSNQVEVAYTPPAISPDASSLYEGCDVAWVSFTRPAGQAGQAADYAVNVTGTATMDLDYTGIPDTLSYVVGQTTISIPIIALEDGLTEGPETITIEVIGTTVCTTSEGVSYTFSIVDVLPVTVTLSDEVINCGESVTLTPVITGGFGYYDIFWGTGETTPSITVSPDDVTTYTYIVTDTCGVDPVNGSTVVSFPAYPPLIVDIGPDQEFTCLEDITVNSTVGGGYGAYTYSWDVNNDTGVSTTTSLVYNTSDEGDVTLTVTDECGTVSTDVMNYTFPPVPVLVNVGPDLDVTCLDVTNLSGVVSGGIGAYTYSWTLDGLEQTETLTYDVQVDEESEIGLIVEDECGNVGSDYLIMDVPPVPVNLELGGDFDVTCIDVSTLVPDVSGGVGAYYYEWSTQYAIVGVDPTLDFQTAESETVSLVVTDECGNEASDFITLSVPQVFMSADAGPDLTTTCIETNTLSVDAGGGVGTYSYTWMVNGQIQGLNPTFDLLTEDDAVITVYVEDQCGNATMDELNVSVPPVPVYVDAGPDLVVSCIDVSLLSAAASGGVGDYSYSWNDGGGVLSVSASADYQTGNNAIVTINVEDECGNSAVDQVAISVPPVPVNLNLSADTAICNGDQIPLNALATGGVGTLSYAWTPMDSGYPQVYVSPGETTTYTVSIIDECGNAAEGSVTVGVEEVEPGFTVEYIGDWGLQLQNYSVNAVSSEWYFGDGSSTTVDNPYYEFSTMEPWQVTLVVTGELGCQQAITQIFYPTADVYVPNSFTPDNDGINDVFFAKGHDLKTFEMWIFSRWGDLIFHSTDINQPWDGSWNGNDYYVADGVFTVMVKAEGIRGNLISKTVNVTIIR